MSTHDIADENRMRRRLRQHEKARAERAQRRSRARIEQALQQYKREA